MSRDLQAFAKLVGFEWEYYMTTPEIVLGRGGKDVNCNVIVSKETAVSRRHFAIRYVPQIRAFEIENLSKNGILINGLYITQESPPFVVRSQADIAFGKRENMRCTFIIPKEPLKSNGNGASKNGAKKKDSKSEVSQTVQLVNFMGKVMVDENRPLACAEITHLVRERFRECIPRGPMQTFENSVRHALSHNGNIFEVDDGAGDEKSNHGLPKVAKFVVRQTQKAYFHRLAITEYAAGVTAKANPIK